MAVTDQSEYLGKNFLAVSLLLLAVLLTGVIGYMILEGWGWFDALYMTVIAFSTVGFHEVRNLDAFGRGFTMLIIFMGLVLISALSASVTSVLVRRELVPGFRTRKMFKRIQAMTMHTILCGVGETGRTIIREFMVARKPLVVIDTDGDLLESVRALYPDLLIVVGDATKDDILLQANVRQARGLITALRDDADNLFVVLSARSLNPNLVIVSRAIEEPSEGKMYKAGASHVISPNITEGSRMAAMMLRPTVVSFLDVMMRDEDIAFRLEEVTVPPGSSLHGKTLQELALPQRTGLMVIAIQQRSSGSERFLYNPQSSTLIRENDVLIVLGDNERIERIGKLMKE
jgi:voltage-gated potassium channel